MTLYVELCSIFTSIRTGKGKALCSAPTCCVSSVCKEQKNAWTCIANRLQGSSTEIVAVFGSVAFDHRLYYARIIPISSCCRSELIIHAINYAAFLCIISVVSLSKVTSALGEEREFPAANFSATLYPSARTLPRVLARIRNDARFVILYS